MALPFVPYHELDGRPNVVVDGSRAPGTVLTLSHWPHSGTPAELAADTSAEIAFRYLDRPDLHVRAEAVSNNHFDEDGLTSVYVLADPHGALARRALVEDVARAGDFATPRTREAARIAFAISALADATTSPLDPALFDLAYPEHCGRLYEELLPRLPDLLDEPDKARDLWEAEDAHYEDSRRAIVDGRVTIAEIPDVDLAVVDLDESWAERTVHRFAQTNRGAVHPMAVHGATERFRLLYRRGRHYQVQFRYETWVQYASRTPMARVDLAPFAARLDEREDGRHWSFDGASEILPSLRLEGDAPSGWEPDRFRDALVAFLRAAPPAWNPYGD
jgi:hypothetical protein